MRTITFKFEPGALALRRPAFREAMMHGIDLPARWVLVAQVLRPLAVLQRRVACEAAAGGVVSSACRSLVAGLDAWTWCRSGLSQWDRRRPELLTAVLVATAVFNWAEEHEQEIRRRLARAAQVARVKTRAALTLLASFGCSIARRR
jgi:hypothetical protein